MLVDGGFMASQSRTVGKGTATEKQVKAVYRCIMGRHYPKSVLNDLIQFLDYPEEFNKAVRVKERKIFVNMTREEEKPALTQEQENEINKNF